MFKQLEKVLKEKLFSQVYISVNADKNDLSIQVLRIKNSQVKEKFYKTFETKNGEIPAQALKMVRAYAKKYPYTYFSAMSKAKEVLCEKSVFEQLRLENLKEDYKVCEINEKYCVYIESKDFLKDAKRFKIQGIDYLFSPFSIIYRFVRDSLESKPLLYLLMERSRFYFLIANNKEIFLAKSVFLEEQPESFLQSEQDESMEMKNEMIEMFLSEIQDDIDNLEEAINLDGVQENNTQGNEEDAQSLIDNLTNIPIIADILQESLRNVYSSKDIDFVEKVVLLDSCQIHQKALSHLEEHLMIEVTKLTFSLVGQLNMLARIENDEHA
ncbi:hypothetical protein [Helicobacter cetorum]|uniref:Uncharacterized protein n=1 Tax=Helicobacter cetorum (strain ATCC BAA-429 / MIT 00-7128) TaxID=182217 RepID=I0EMU4_HELC0|nr:hypothetical protein [Helicobacter cetorum]AFI04263.1 hypothetical protein HCW_04980 [Helicobacter cetorum MIT 00-7128]